MTQLFANNAYGSLGATLSNSATSLTLASGQGARFPAPTAGDYFLLTLVGLDSNGLENTWEVVKVTGRTTDALTIERAQESTTAVTWAAGTRVELRATAGTFYKFLPTDGGTLTGNLNLASGTKITGDFSNASYASRVYVQSSTTNGSTVLSVLPNGTAVNSQLNLWGNSDPTNAPLGVMVINASSVRLQSSAAGTGTILPLSFWIGASEAARFDALSRNFLVGTTTDNGTDKLQVNGSVLATSFTGSGANLTGFTSGQITTALGFTPYNSTNPSGYITSSALSPYLTSATAASTYAPISTTVTLAGTQTITNKTASGLVLNDGFTEEVFTVTGTNPALSPTNGSIQTWTLTANSTPTAGTWADGQSITLMIDDGTARTITWTSLAVTWKTDSGSAPTLNTTGLTAIALWKVGTTIYGARVGNA